MSNPVWRTENGPSEMFTDQPQTECRRLAFVITELEVGGAERCLTNLVLGLDRQRFAPVVYSLWPRPAPEQSELVTRLETAGVPIRFLGIRYPRQFRQGSRQLTRLLAEQRPELLQTFLFHANVIGAFSGWRMKIPKVVLGMRVADRSGWRMMMERVASRFVNRVVCVSESVATFARDEVRVSANKVGVIPNGIDTSLFPTSSVVDFADLGVPRGRRVIAVVGRLHAQKGLDWLLRVAPQFLAEVSDVDLLIVGQGLEENALRSLAETLKIADRVHFVGWRPDVPAILSGSSLLVLTSRWEGMPNVVLEAMATGLPVVVTQAEGVAELLGPLAEQQAVKFGDDQALASRVASILRDPQRARYLGQLNRARIESEYSLQRMVAQYERLYCELLSSR